MNRPPVSSRLEPDARPSPGARGFRTRLQVAMMLVISGVTAVALWLTQRNMAAAFEQELQREFQGELAALDGIQELRQAALLERCRTLVRRARIHAALEDDALDLLYPSAKDELRDVMARDLELSDEHAAYALQAAFYRFLDRHGALIAANDASDAGELRPEEEVRLALPSSPDRPQLGYLARRAEDGSEHVSEVLAMPIVSTETSEAIASLVLGFKPAEFAGARTEPGIKRGVWLDGALHLDGFAAGELATLAREVGAAIVANGGESSSFARDVEGAPHLLFYKQLNPGSLFPPAYEVCMYPVAELQARQAKVQWQVLGAGALLLLLGLVASHVVATRLSRPVEKLESDSAENRVQRELAEAALESTSEELQRAARFSADASHQLKTPVTVLRAGLEELLAREHLSTEECHDISALIHQTYRLSSVIEDLLLLSRMDAGRLKIEFGTVNLTQLVEAALDDHGAVPGDLAIDVETNSAEPLRVAGEKRYIALILQNLLENARKYNRPGGRIRIGTKAQGEDVFVAVANTGAAIPVAAQEHIFERFHRGAMGENVPGYGLGLNLARELARLHGGDLRLVRSDGEWTEFEVRFQLAHNTRVDSGGGT